MTNPGETQGFRLALLANIALVVIFTAAYLLSGLTVILAEAFDAASDVIISGFLLISFIWSQKPADESHMFGYGRVQNVSSLVAAGIFIMILSLETFRQAVPELLSPATAVEVPDTGLGIAVTVLAAVVTAAPLVAILRNPERGAAMKAQLVALLEMELAYLIALGALILVSYGYPAANPVSAIIIGLLILGSGIYLFRENADYLIGRAPPAGVIREIEETAKSVSGVLGVHDLLAEYVGPGAMHIWFHIELALGTPIEEADRIAEEVRSRVMEKPECRYCVIHVDAAPKRPGLAM